MTTATRTPVRITASPPASAAALVAAIYARKSTEQKHVAEDAKSVTRQVERSTAFASDQGWTVAPEHVYVDDAVSGAEFEKRDGLMRLIAAAKAKRFSVLITMDLDRLGREQSERSYWVKKLDQAGVAIWEYLKKKRLSLDTPTDRFLESANSFAAEMEKAQASVRVLDAQTQRAERGYVANGSTYGYTHVAVMKDDDKRDHVERRIDPTKAKVVRRIFTLCLDGWGPRRIADTLNAQGVPAPPSRRWEKDEHKKRVRLIPSRWLASTVRDMLRRKLYAGTLEWGRTRQKDRWGQRKKSYRENPITVAVPHLRIIDEQTWTRVQAITDARRKAAQGDRFAAQRAGVKFSGEKYLLSGGVARCGGCGGNLIVWRRHRHVTQSVKKTLSTSEERATVKLACGHEATLRKRDRKRTRCTQCPPLKVTTAYRCHTLHSRGVVGCPKGAGIHALSVTAADRAVLLSLINDDETQAAWIENVIAKLVREAKGGSTDDPIADERKALEKKIANLSDAISEGGDIPALVTKLKETQARLDMLKRAPRPPKLTVAQAEKLETKLRLGFKSLRGWLTQPTEVTKPLLGMLLAEPITFTPTRRHVTFSGKLRLGRLIEGVLGLNGTRSAQRHQARAGVVNGYEALALLNGDSHTTSYVSSG